MARKNGLLGRLSREELEGDEGLTGVPAEGAMDVAEVVESDAVNDEINEEAVELQEDQAAMEDAMDIADELQETVDEGEELLETPEEVDETAAVIAQEHLKTCMRLLGADDMIAIPSRESTKESPVTALRLSIEGAKEFIDKIIESIKLMWGKLKNGIKKLWVKIVVMMNRSAAAAEALKKKLANLDDSEAKFDEAQEKAAVGQVGILAYAEGTDLKAAFVTTVLGSASSAERMTRVTKDILSNFKNGLKDSEGMKSDKIVESMTLDKALEKLNTKLEKDGATVGVVRLSGTSCKYVETDKEGKVKTETFSMSEDDKKAAKVECAKKTDVSNMLNAVISAAKGSKALNDAAVKSLNTQDAEIATMLKAMSSDNEIAASIRHSINVARVTGTSLALDGVLGQVALTKNVLAYCNICMKAYKGKEAK